MVENGEADVIIVWKWSRFARNRHDWAVALDRVEVAGGTLESSTEPVDVTTSNGRFARGVLAELAAFESERIGDVWKEVQQRRVGAGFSASGNDHWGYVHEKGSVDQPDPVTGPVLADLYQRFIDGDSLRVLCTWLNNHGYRGLRGSRFSPTTLALVLDAGFGAGLISYHGELSRGAHPPVISQPQWDAYRAARARRAISRRSENTTYLLSGLLVCMHRHPDGSTCGYSMAGSGKGGSSNRAYYRCLAFNHGEAHPSSQVYAPVVERPVMAWLETWAAELNSRAAIITLDERRTARNRDEASQIEMWVKDLDKKLAQLTVHLVSGLVPEGAYALARDEILAERTGLAARLAEMSASTAIAMPSVPDLVRTWPDLPMGERREMLRRLISRIEVVPGKPTATVNIVPIWKSDDR